jgi:hypothetical protein
MKKSKKTSSLTTGAGLILRLLKSTCGTGVGLGAAVSIDLCHRSGLEYLSHGFQTQATVAAGASVDGVCWYTYLVHYTLVWI